MYPIINILGRPVPAAVLLLIGAVWAWMWLSARLGRERELDEEAISNMIFFGLLGAVAGGRLAYVAGNWPAYQDNLPAILSPTLTAFNASAGILIGALTSLLYSRYAKLPLTPALDALAVGGALALALAALARFLSGAGYGEPTSVPWAIYLWGEWRHPVQLYQSLMLVLVAGALWWGRRRFARPGELSALMLVGYGLTRLALEPYQADTPLLAGFRVMQIVGLGLALSGVWWLYRGRFAQKTGPVS